jgi:ribosomal protein S18 acetylase RimI-like enzyme
LAYQIVRDLISKAARHETRVLGLFVDKQNQRAIRFYEHPGFLALPAGGKKYVRMYLYLRGPSGS